METSGTGKGPIQSISPVYLSRYAPERKEAPARLTQAGEPESPSSEPVIITLERSGEGNDSYVSGQLPVFVYRERFSSHTSLPFVAQKIAQETDHSTAAKGLPFYRNVALAYQRAEGSDRHPFPNPWPLNLRA